VHLKRACKLTVSAVNMPLLKRELIFDAWLHYNFILIY